MSIILGALGGAGDALQKIGATNQKALLDRETMQDNAKLSSDLALQREEALIQFKQTLGDKARTEQVQRIDTAAGGIADQAVSAKRGIVEGGIADRSTWTPEQQAAVDQSLGMDKQKIAADPKTRTQAAIATGDISPKDAATLDAKSEADLTRLMLGEQRNQTMALIASGHDDTRKLVAGMVAASKKDGAAKEDRVIVHQFLAQYDRKIAGNQSEIRSLRASLKNSFDPDEKKDIQAQISQLEGQNKNLEKAQMQYAKDSGVKVPEVATDAPKSAVVPSLPAGAKKVGTSGGKAVYETPDGKRFIEN